MFKVQTGRVIKIISKRVGLTKVILNVNDEEQKAIGYNDLIGEINLDDEVIVNTTARALALGTGGYDFIIWILGKTNDFLKGSGHIMKLRYTPYQIKTLSVEEPASPYHQQIESFNSLDNTPVVVATLHSMIAPIVAMIKSKIPELNINYIMTDGAALPISLSNLVYFLQDENLIDQTITVGHAFGGGLEAVNVYSGLIAAKEINQADIIVVAMGPGIVGTNTKYGFSGVEQAEILHAVSTLGGIPIAVPRVSFADDRSRHYGLSHHSRTNLGELTLIKVKLGLPYLSSAENDLLQEQLISSNIINKHEVLYRSSDGIIEELSRLNFELKSMGRSIIDDPVYFSTAGIAGILAVEELERRE